MSAGKSSAVAGVASELGCEVAHTPSGGAEIEQADLLRAFDVDLDLFAENPIAPPIARGRGRPPGSPNRSTTQLRKLLLQSGYRDPAEFLAALVTQDAKMLARSLACEPIEALKLQRQAATDLMPYFHQRMPQETDAKPAEARPLVVIMSGDARVAQQREDGTLSIYDVQANQTLSGITIEEPHAEVPHDES